MRIKRKLSQALAALVIAVPAAVSAAAPAHAVGPALLPVTVTNNTGRGEAVHLYVIGINLNTNRLGYVTKSGAFTPWPAGSIPPSPAPDASIAGPGNGGATTLQFPRGFSGRVYFSLGERLKFFLTPDGLVQPAPWAAGDPNRNILFDWSEFTYNDAGLWLNSSQVDMFAVPHAVTVTGANGVTAKTGEPVNNGRNAVINGIKAQPGWGNTVYTRPDGTVLRVLAPGKAAQAGLMSANYLDSYIASAWNAYTGKTLTVVPFADQPNTRYFGRTSGNVMNFTNSAGQRVASFNRPSTASVWGCDGDLPAPNDLVVGPISRTLCAALNRGTLGTIDTQPSTNAAQFYQNSPTNQYAKIIHQHMADGKAYAFAFDDVGAFESLVHNGDPRAAGLILTPFGAGGPNPPPPPGAVPVVSDWHGKCIDVPSGTFVDSAPLQGWTCNGSGAQKWTFTNGTLQAGGKCMDVAAGSTANGAAVQLYTCNGTGAQQFVLSAAGDLVNPQANKCVDIKDWNSGDGARLQLWECAGTANQKWHKG
ncbi:glycoside hydrolase family 64 protein [Couchioplanes caeruleus]|uniref:Glucan endo-1,3-beta-D-glucosidase n=2 Tax=Couchioplanes caeruleus TaxID=56438 RepID=A0A1K0FH87_9ACTN|nr:glycoside hydrolase family 64 protein [Couchioplanes caeruleus]OJF12096.1 glucan endo-1,3-beta-D-glucosidase [Couchioplanes caeruleus subsp. caeruleus]ROP30772.1 ricin-type beta-trefoil lectin protein [Couchioplanes caeruleus]